MTSERETPASDSSEPELPAKVPENTDAVTPDLPPLDTPAPDLWASGSAEEAEAAGAADDTDGAPPPEADHAAADDPTDPAERRDPDPQEPTD
ncbi:hypothetical protein [Streptomyces sp. NRRL F-2664]|uniref:hypothetical protein n=1 Tax=Streptomyces sp. NRRL F-2664 TaxID=1463842 RepID=UPI0004C94B7C|nr:hypothetical protein [Streptomyces sp. NRRL F-2664]